jgi:hypothetical protein
VLGDFVADVGRSHWELSYPRSYPARIPRHEALLTFP